MKESITYKVYINGLDRNQYCKASEGSSQIYSCNIRASIGHHDFSLKIRSCYGYEIETESYTKISDYNLKAFNTVVKQLIKTLTKAQNTQRSHSYLALDRAYQITNFWQLLKELDSSIDYQENKPKLETFKAIEDQACNVAVANKLAENNQATINN
jgi:hypothetical protein